jgi:hypothetical protein
VGSSKRRLLKAGGPASLRNWLASAAETLNL